MSDSKLNKRQDASSSTVSAPITTETLFIIGGVVLGICSLILAALLYQIIRRRLLKLPKINIESPGTTSLEDLNIPPEQNDKFLSVPGLDRV
jgi:hypothetical protein